MIDLAIALPTVTPRKAIENVIINFIQVIEIRLWQILAGQISQVGLDGITANRVAANINQKAKGDRVEQIGARNVNAAGDAVFKVKQTID